MKCNENFPVLHFVCHTFFIFTARGGEMCGGFLLLFLSFYVRYELPDQMKGGHRSKLKCGIREEAGNKGKSELSLKQKIYTKVYPKLKNSMPNIYCPSSIGIRIGVNCLVDRNLTGSATWICCFQNGMWSSWFNALTPLCKKEIN